MAPPSTPTPHPWRYLAALGVLLVVMVLGVLGGNIASPSNWHKSFVVGRGLDLSSGTSITLKAVTTKQPGQTTAPPPSSEAMTKAVQIITNRVEATGLTGATVVPQGSDQIVVSVPGAGAQKVASLVGETALLRMRQVLLEAPNYSSSATPTPSASATPGTSASPSASATPKATAGTSASATPSGGTGQAAGAAKLGAAASASPSPSASPSAPASPSPSSPGKQVLSTTADGQGNPAALTTTTAALFDRVNCNDKNWKTQIYGANPNAWDAPDAQTIACFNGVKYAMDKAVVQGKDLSNVQAQDQTTGWVVTFNVRNPAAGNLGKLTTQMAGQYYDSGKGVATSPLDLLAVVLDGDLQGQPPQVQSAISTSGEINGGTGGFSQGQATQLANVLKYGSLPLSFQNLFTSSVSPSLGSDQLSAGLTAAVVGLLLVVIYSFLYYRGLGIVSVMSLGIAAALSYLSVVLLSKSAGFTLSLAGIAGLIVAIGITADSFIVYFERLRDEVREGKSLRAAVERGWGRARRTILVADAVSFLAALLLYILAVGDVRGFAFTLGLTTLIDVVVVFLFTKPMITLLARTKFFGQGHPLSGLDPARLGARAPWRGSRRPASGTSASAAGRTTTSTREA
ncbi:MAG TPA: protein translocase subunit SecD [Streptosporangiaceae bacterium]|nr:protein translocase subunit SecD [Streptosporangiaceae bacterium]